jgi:hypothetical protein
MMLWAKGSAMRKRRMAEDKNERRINTLKWRVASHRYPHKNEAGMEQKMAMDVITPNATRGPPKMLVSLKATM